MIAIQPTIANRAHLERIMAARLQREGHELDAERRLLAKRMAGARLGKAA